MNAMVRIVRIARDCARPVLLVGAAFAGPALVEAEEDIRDIRGPKSVLASSSWVPAVLAGAVVIVALCAFAIWRRRGRHRGARPRILTLSEETLQRLDETKPLMQPDSAREFGIAASEVIRNYIEKRFAVIATQRTTEEVSCKLCCKPRMRRCRATARYSRSSCRSATSSNSRAPRWRSRIWSHCSKALGVLYWRPESHPSHDPVSAARVVLGPGRVTPHHSLERAARTGRRR